MAAVDQVRRDEIREKGPAHKALLHKTRFIWLKNPLESHRGAAPAPGRTRTLMKINRAYLLKEFFAHFWSYRRAGWAKRYLRWFWWATHSRLPPLATSPGCSPPRGGHPQLLPHAHRRRRRLEQQGQAHHSQSLRLQDRKNYIRNLYHCICGLPLPDHAYKEPVLACPIPWAPGTAAIRAQRWHRPCPRALQG